MKDSKKLLLASLVASPLLTVALVFYTRWLVEMALEWSTSTQLNAVATLGAILLLGATAVSESYIVREVVHRYQRATNDNPKWLADQREDERRRIRETWLLWGVFLGIPVILNAFVADKASGGELLRWKGEFSRVATANTLLRSDDPDIRQQGIFEAMGLNDRRPGKYLARIIYRRQKDAAYAAWVAAARREEGAVVPTRWLFLDGDEDQRKTAITSLARHGDTRGAELALEALRRGEQPAIECMIALGILGWEPAEPLLADRAVDGKQAEIARAAAMWAVTMIEQDRFRRSFQVHSATGQGGETFKAPMRSGYEPMLAALDGDSQVLRCAAVQGLRYAGPVESAQDLMRAFDRSSHMDKCPELAVAQFTTVKWVLVKQGLLRSQIIDALAGVGNKTVVKWLEAKAADRKNADEVILKASDLARQIRALR